MFTLAPLPVMRSVGLAEPLGEGPIVVSPDNVVFAVTIEVADADDVPVARDVGVEVGAVAGEAAGGLTQPVGHRCRRRARHRMSALPSPLKSPVPAMCQSVATLRRSCAVAGERRRWPGQSQSVTVPSSARHRMSALPSPLKSPVPTMCQLVATLDVKLLRCPRSRRRLGRASR